MKVCIVSPHYSTRITPSLTQLKQLYRHNGLLSAALARRAHDVVVVQAFDQDHVETQNAVEFRYVRTPERSAPRLAGGKFGVDLLLRTNVRPIIHALQDARPDSVHMFGLPLLQPLLEIGRWCAKTGRPLTVSYHGGAPRRAPWLHGVEHRILQRCQAVFFTSAVQADPWLAKGLLREEQVVPCMEVSSSFAPADRKSARARTKMHGRPVFVWNARLHPIKDPLTALKGFALIRERWPDARLYMIYLTNEMQAEVISAIAGNPLLKESVEMRGRIPSEAVEDFLNSADFLIQTSLREFSSYSVLEAMSCGVIPIVTDIPAFRAMTGNGSCGIQFPTGDYKSMAERTLAFDLGNLPALSRRVRDRFVTFLSYDAIARIYEAALMPGTGSVPSSKPASQIRAP